MANPFRHQGSNIENTVPDMYDETRGRHRSTSISPDWGDDPPPAPLRMAQRDVLVIPDASMLSASRSRSISRGITPLGPPLPIVPSVPMPFAGHGPFEGRRNRRNSSPDTNPLLQVLPIALSTAGQPSSHDLVGRRRRSDSSPNITPPGPPLPVEPLIPRPPVRGSSSIHRRRNSSLNISPTGPHLPVVLPIARPSGRSSASRHHHRRGHRSIPCGVAPPSPPSRTTSLIPRPSGNNSSGRHRHRHQHDFAAPAHVGPSNQVITTIAAKNSGRVAHGMGHLTAPGRHRRSHRRSHRRIHGRSHRRTASRGRRRRRTVSRGRRRRRSCSRGRRRSRSPSDGHQDYHSRQQETLNDGIIASESSDISTLSSDAALDGGSRLFHLSTCPSSYKDQGKEQESSKGAMKMTPTILMAYKTCRGPVGSGDQPQHSGDKLIEHLSQRTELIPKNAGPRDRDGKALVDEAVASIDEIQSRSMTVDEDRATVAHLNRPEGFHHMTTTDEKSAAMADLERSYKDTVAKSSGPGNHHDWEEFLDDGEGPIGETLIGPCDFAMFAEGAMRHDSDNQVVSAERVSNKPDNPKRMRPDTPPNGNLSFKPSYDRLDIEVELGHRSADGNSIYTAEQPEDETNIKFLPTGIPYSGMEPKQRSYWAFDRMAPGAARTLMEMRYGVPGGAGYPEMDQDGRPTGNVVPTRVHVNTRIGSLETQCPTSYRRASSDQAYTNSPSSSDSYTTPTKASAAVRYSLPSNPYGLGLGISGPDHIPKRDSSSNFGKVPTAPPAAPLRHHGRTHIPEAASGFGGPMAISDGVQKPGSSVSTDLDLNKPLPSLPKKYNPQIIGDMPKLAAPDHIHPGKDTQNMKDVFTFRMPNNESYVAPSKIRYDQDNQKENPFIFSMPKNWSQEIPAYAPRGQDNYTHQYEASDGAAHTFVMKKGPSVPAGGEAPESNGQGQSSTRKFLAKLVKPVRMLRKRSKSVSSIDHTTLVEDDHVYSTDKNGIVVRAWRSFKRLSLGTQGVVLDDSKGMMVDEFGMMMTTAVEATTQANTIANSGTSRHQFAPTGGQYDRNSAPSSIKTGDSHRHSWSTMSGGNGESREFGVAKKDNNHHHSLTMGGRYDGNKASGTTTNYIPDIPVSEYTVNPRTRRLKILQPSDKGGKNMFPRRTFVEMREDARIRNEMRATAENSNVTAEEDVGSMRARWSTNSIEGLPNLENSSVHPSEDSERVGSKRVRWSDI